MEYGRRLKTIGWDVGEMVVVHTLNDLVGEVTKKSLNGDGEYDTWLTMKMVPVSGAKLLI